MTRPRKNPAASRIRTRESSALEVDAFPLGQRGSVFQRDSGSEFQTVGPKTEKDLFPKVSRERRGTVSNEVSMERSVLEGQYG